MDEIKILNNEYDLSTSSDVDLATIMKDQCETFIMCKYELSTAILEAWDRIDYISREIIKRNETVYL